MGEAELHEEFLALADTENYTFDNDHDFSTEDPEALLEAAVEAVAESSDAISDSEVFDVYRSILKHSAVVAGTLMSKLLDSLSSGLAAELDATLRDMDTADPGTFLVHRAPLEKYAFLLCWFVSAAEKVKASDDDVAPKAKRGRGGKAGRGGVGKAGRGGVRATSKKYASSVWSWEEHIPAVLGLISKVLNHLKAHTQRIWATSQEREAFITCIMKPALQIAEYESYMKVQEIKMSVFKVICLGVKHHGQALALQINIIQFLQFFEHLSEAMADCLIILANEFNFTQLGDEVIRDIAGKNFGAQDAKGPRIFAKFLIKYAEGCPRSVMKQLSLLQVQLDSEAYPMRQAILEVIGAIITDLATNEGEGEVDVKKNQKQIGKLLDLILERVLDNSSYVRSKVFAVLTKLVQIKQYKFPKHRLKATEEAVNALQDKNSSVRKAAVVTLQYLLQTHPYVMHGGLLDRNLWMPDYEETLEELKKLEGSVGKVVQEPQEGEEADAEPKKKKSKKSGEDESMDVDGGEEDETEDEGGGDTEPEDEDDMQVDEDDADPEATPKKRSKKRAKLQPRKSELDVNALNEEQAAVARLDEHQFLQLKLKKKFLVDALHFIGMIEGCMDLMCELLGSTAKAEVLEVMEFFKIAHEYQFEGAQDGIRKMLHLIWQKDNNTTSSEEGQQLKGIQQRLLECYKHLYFDPIADLDAKAQVNRIAKNLIERTYGATLAELTSLEEMMRIMMEENQIHQDIIAKLWQVYSSQAALPKPQRRGSIIILGMLAIAKRSVLTDKVEVMLKIGLGSLGKADLILARYTCVALQRLNGSAKKVKGSLIDKTQRIEMSSPIFRKLKNAIMHPSHTKEWFGMAEQAINTVYALGEHPDEFCDDVIKLLTARAFTRKVVESKPSVDKPEATSTGAGEGEGGEGEGEGEAEGGEEAGDVTMTVDGEGDVSMLEPTSTRGPSSTPAPGAEGEDSQGTEKDVGDAFEMAQLLFVVGHVAIKHIVFLELVEREWKRQKDEKQAADKKATADKKSAKDKEADELDQVAGNAEDEIGDRIAEVREKELLFGEHSLLAMYGPMIVHICGSPHKFKNRTLRAAAILAFSKFLCVSSAFCDTNHRLLFKILETSRDANIRSNIVIALGDVAVSFNTIIDENSNELYKGLSDKDLIVRKNTLMVLTHLILNGMIKVKGQLGEMAKCLEAPEKRISDLAKMFFDDLAKKENAIYNNLPDVISHLSVGDHAVDEEKFQSTLTFIFKYIEKEKQAEAIVEKLCQRFRLSEDPRQWRDIAFCLSLLPFKSERSVKKLIEGLQYYRDKLHEPKVFERFTEILQKARANKSKDKPDSELDEFEKILDEHRQQGEDDQALEKRVEGKKAAAKKRAAKKTTTRSKKTTTRATTPAAAADNDMYSD